MNHEFVEKFKNEGILRICPLAVYQSIQDIRQDESEGTQINKFIGSGSLTSAQAKSILGVDVHSVNFEPGWDEATKFRRLLPAAYVLSTSTIQSNDLMKRFECDDYFIISNVVALKQAIERAISKYIEVQHSVDHHVEYNVDKDTHISIEELMNTDDSERSVDGMLYFRKTIGYITESEYRFVFVVESENPLPELYLKFTPDEIKASCQFRSDDAWISSNYAGIGRNDQCPCGSKKKFKRCHGKK